MNNINLNNVSFGSRFYLKPKILMNIGQSIKPATKSHYDNIFYKTNLNEKLRNTEGALADAISNINKPSYLRKEPIMENPIALKNRLNKEFENIKPTKRKIKLFRGICTISDKDYKKFKNYRKGTIQVPDKGFGYFCRDHKEAKGFAVHEYCSGPNPVIFEVEIPPNSRISELEGVLLPSPTSPEWPLPRLKHEIVLPAGSYFGVTKDSEIDKEGILRVFLKYLDRW